MGFEVLGKRALVTGASSGIGAAVAIGLAQRGATVGICARRADRLDEVLARCREHAPDSRRWVVDLADLDAIEAFARRTDDELGGVDLLVNNAGIPKRKLVSALRPDEIDGTIRLNYLSPVRLVLALLPRMLARGDGAIVSIASVAARLSPPGEAAYAASKAALTAFSEALAAELWGGRVSVHVLHPGIVATELFDLPDNDPSFADDIDPLPASAVGDALVEQLAAGTFEAFVPDWFRDVASSKAADIDGYLAGASAYFAAKAGPGLDF